MPPETVIPINGPPLREWLLIAPEIFLAFWGLVVLLLDVIALRETPYETRRRILGLTSLGGVVVAALLAMLRLVPDALGIDVMTDDLSIFGGTLSADASTAWINLIIPLLLALAIGLVMSARFTEALGEFYALMIWAAVGMMLLVAAEELLTLFVTLETMTICLYLMTALEKDRKRSAEGGLKYFIYGAVSSAIFLFGLSLVYGLSGSTRLSAVGEALTGASGVQALEGNIAGALAVLFLLVGFGFKIAAAPFHQWAPDAYEGAPAPAAAWIGSASKLASFVAFLKVFIIGLGAWATNPRQLATPGWVTILALISAISMTYGNFAALSQRNLKRMLAYSSIAHAGYVLVGVIAVAVSSHHLAAAGAVLFYLVTYAFTTIGAFAVAAWLARDLGSDDIDDLDGLASTSPLLASCILILMLSLIGLPPLAGFFGKLYMFMEALNTNEQGRLTLTWLVLLALLNSVVSAFYYVRVLKAMFLRPVRGVGVSSAPSSIYWPIGIATIVAILFGVLPGLLLEPMQAAAVPMLSTQVDSRYATTGAGPDSTAATVAPPTQSSTPPSHTNPPTGEATARNGDR